MSVQRNKIAYVTGSSRGIGKALVKLLLQNGYEVVGISRTNDFTADNYRFDQLDLTDISAVKNYVFDISGDEVVLINNAGAIGEIAPTGSVSNDSIHKAMNINTIAPQILINTFIRQFSNNSGKFHVLNISSGAGKRPIESWATYCASKAAIDLYSETVALELEWKQKNNWFIHSCAPGVVDTRMQEEIRSSDIQDFKHVDNFVAYKENDDLYTPEYVAQKLFEVISKPESFKEVIISVRDF